MNYLEKNQNQNNPEIKISIRFLSAVFFFTFILFSMAATHLFATGNQIESKKNEQQMWASDYMVDSKLGMFTVSSVPSNLPLNPVKRAKGLFEKTSDDTRSDLMANLPSMNYIGSTNSGTGSQNFLTASGPGPDGGINVVPSSLTLEDGSPSPPPGDSQDPAVPDLPYDDSGSKTIAPVNLR